MSVIDLSAATPASRNHVAEKEFGEQLQLNALAQMLALLNQGKPQISPAHRQAVELLQTEGIAVAIDSWRNCATLESTHGSRRFARKSWTRTLRQSKPPRKRVKPRSMTRPPTINRPPRVI